MTASRTTYRALLHDGLSTSARTWPDKTAVDTGKEACSFRELDNSASRLAAALQSRGLCRGDRVAIFMDNTIACAIGIFAVLKAGGVFLVINPQTKHDKLCFIANDCTIRHLLTDIHLAEVASAVVGNVPSLTHIIVSGQDGDLQPLSGSGIKAEWLRDLLPAVRANCGSPAPSRPIWPH
jgi:long-chain acyl-CoA synthetase